MVEDKLFHVYMILRTQADITEARVVGDLNRIIQQWKELPMGFITGGIVKEVEQQNNEALVCDNHPDDEPTRIALRFCGGCSAFVCEECYKEHNDSPSLPEQRFDSEVNHPTEYPCTKCNKDMGYHGWLMALDNICKSCGGEQASFPGEGRSN